jgi:hypothetical protein
MNQSTALSRFRTIGTGLAFIVMPLVFVFAFAGHPELLSPRFLGPQELILRARSSPVLHLGHALVTLNTALLVVIALHFIKILDRGSTAWVGFIGGALAVLGALALAADKGALCLTMSALDTVPDGDFQAMMPGLLAIFGKEGWLVLIWGLLLLPLGFGLQAVALLRTRAIPRWQAGLFLVGVLFVGTPDGVEIVNLTAAILLTAAFLPYGVRLITRDPEAPLGSAAG